eukprot:CAMPEP_0195517094 /NCGR_PEP_ID=MMETSP0794_2-20130614/9677_1 /TAXON_ID=515487 /ORGANISM="Stephanopyxis turris, Strain CCMP 815" /LENGTH=138 /DNA_ID=CAMNT_0040645845 /DNA_START=168 /DNA_END=584 /DNA_ORIENTATION=+
MEDTTTVNAFADTSYSTNNRGVTSSLNAASSDTNNDNNDNGVDAPSDELPRLMPASEDNTNIPRLQFGETLKLDHLGPVIINADGTTRQIANWDAMTKQEQTVTWRRISKRNQERIEALQKKAAAEEGKEEDENRGEL